VPRYNKKFVASLRKCCSRAFLSLALVSPILVSGAPAVAQVDSSASPARQTHRGHRGTSIIDDRVKVLAKNLDLNESQQSAVKRILEQRQQETLRLRLDPSISGDARIDRFRAIQDNTVQRIRAVLTEEQRKKYDPLAVRRIPPAPQQPSVEDWLKATTPK
jgi:Spy/CpxP family protein refolding chaperone